MTIYVDELPKNCKDCKFQCFGECLNGADILNCDYSSMKCHLKRGKVKDCPLQSLAEYTKQVRKEVCEQIYKVFTKESMWSELKSWWLHNESCEELKNCLDAIVEETSVENIVKRFGKDSFFYKYLDQIQGETK